MWWWPCVRVSVDRPVIDHQDLAGGRSVAPSQCVKVEIYSPRIDCLFVSNYNVRSTSAAAANKPSGNTFSCSDVELYRPRTPLQRCVRANVGVVFSSVARLMCLMRD